MANTAVDYSKANEMTIQDRCVVLSVEFRTYGTSRKLNMDKIETDADKNRIHATKHILDSDNMEAIHKVFRKTYAWLWTKCLPAPLRAGMYLLPVELIEEVDAKLKQTEEEIKPFIEALKEELPTLMETDRRQLKSQFNEDDYPTEKEIDDAFYIESRYIDFKVPDKLKTITGRMYAREIEKDKKAWEEAAEDVKAFLRKTMNDFIEQFAGQLKIEKTKKGEKRGRIYDSTIDNLKQFAEDFSSRNLANDSALMKLVAKVKVAIDGIDADTLREDDRLRSRLAETMEKVKDEMSNLMKRPVRAIELE